jgi:hypothetical protein
MVLTCRVTFLEERFDAFSAGLPILGQTFKYQRAGE